MSKIIIDSSSIYNFVRLIRQFDIRRMYFDTRPWTSDAMELIENIIEAFLLYDEVCFDKDSIESEIYYYENLPILDLQFCSLVSTRMGTLSEYSNILTNLNLKNEQVAKISRQIEYDWESFVDAHGNVRFFNLNPQDDYYNTMCNQFIRRYSDAFKSNKMDIDQTVFYNIIRYLYYLRLSIENEANLAIHPNRGIFALAFSNYKPFFESRSIINNFKKCIDSLQYRFNRWMPINRNIIRIPLVANYVISQLEQSSPSALFDLIQEIRETKEAKAFRSGLNEFISIYYTNKSDFSRIIDELNDAVDLWSKRIDIIPNQRERIITLSEGNISIALNLGIVSLGTNAPIRSITTTDDCNHQTSSKLLCFIHNTIKSYPI